MDQESWDGLEEDKRAMLKAEFDALVAGGKSEIEAVQELTEKEQASVTEIVAPVDGEDRAGAPDIEKIPLTDLLEAIDRAVAAGKTPLVVDRSEHGVVDTFFSYRSVQVLDAKKLGLDRSLKKIPVPELLDEARAKLVNALKYGFPFVVACQTVLISFSPYCTIAPLYYTSLVIVLHF